MKIGLLLCGALVGAIPATVAAQTSNDDTRCVLLSAGYARLAKDEKSRRAASMTGAFFLGRLSGRMSESALAAAIRAQGKGLPAQRAEQIMRACAARAAVAEKQMAEAARQVEASRQKPVR